jgi:CHAD domain-containing protein
LLTVLQLDSDTTSTLKRRLKKLTKQLGAVRELDVSMIVIQELGRDPRYPSTAVKRVTASIEDARRAARDHLVTKLPLAKLRRLAYRLEQAVRRRESNKGGHRPGKHESRRAWLWTGDARAVRRADQVRLAVEAAGAMYNAERLHEVRIALKKLRYAAELRVEARHRRATADIGVLKGVQDLLGRLHDLEVLIAHVRHMQASPRAPEVTEWHELGLVVHAVEDECRGLHARYIHGRTKLIAVVDRIAGAKLRRVLVRHRAIS